MPREHFNLDVIKNDIIERKCGQIYEIKFQCHKAILFGSLAAFFL